MSKPEPVCEQEDRVAARMLVFTFKEKHVTLMPPATSTGSTPFKIMQQYGRYTACAFEATARPLPAADVKGAAACTPCNPDAC